MYIDSLIGLYVGHLSMKLCIMMIYTQVKLIYLKNISKLALTQQKFNVIINTLNQAIITRTDDGHLNFCNKFGLGLIQEMPSSAGASDQMQNHLQRLNQMECTVDNLLKQS